MKRRVPELAMVPMFCSISWAVMPMPLSVMVSVRAFLSARMVIFQASSSRCSDAWVSASNRARSIASDAFDTSSRRKISFFEYKE